MEQTFRFPAAYETSILGLLLAVLAVPNILSDRISEFHHKHILRKVLKSTMPTLRTALDSFEESIGEAASLTDELDSIMQRQQDNDIPRAVQKGLEREKRNCKHEVAYQANIARRSIQVIRQHEQQVKKQYSKHLPPREVREAWQKAPYEEKRWSDLEAQTKIFTKPGRCDFDEYDKWLDSPGGARTKLEKALEQHLKDEERWLFNAKSELSDIVGVLKQQAGRKPLRDYGMSLDDYKQVLERRFLKATNHCRSHLRALRSIYEAPGQLDPTSESMQELPEALEDAEKLTALVAKAKIWCKPGRSYIGAERYMDADWAPRAILEDAGLVSSQDDLTKYCRSL